MSTKQPTVMDIPVSPKFEARVIDLATKLFGPNPDYGVGITENKRYGYVCYLYIRSIPYIYTNQHAFKFLAKRKLIELIKRAAALSAYNEKKRKERKF